MEEGRGRDEKKKWWLSNTNEWIGDWHEIVPTSPPTSKLLRFMMSTHDWKQLRNREEERLDRIWSVPSDWRIHATSVAERLLHSKEEKNEEDKELEEENKEKKRRWELQCNVTDSCLTEQMFPTCSLPFQPQPQPFHCSNYCFCSLNPGCFCPVTSSSFL